MAAIDLKQNFARILRALEGKGMKPTNIAKAMGYTTTTQLNSALTGDSLLSTKAILGLVENLLVNPNHLFLGKGEMFLSDEDASDIEKLKKENAEWIHRHNEALKTIMGLNEIIQKLDKRNADLIDMSAAAIKYHKEQKPDSELERTLDINKRLIEVLKYHGLIPHSSTEINITELEATMKPKKK